MQSTQTRLDAIDGWRTISVLLVIGAHLGSISSIAYQGSGFLADEVLHPLLDQTGRLGVYIFFLISGFVICRGMITESKRAGRVSTSAFYVRRIFRIVPPLLLYLTTVFVLWKLGVVDSSLAIFRPLTFSCNLGSVQAITDACGGMLGAHTWSLSVEEQFYLVMPLLWVLSGSRKAVSMHLACVAVIAVWLGLMVAGMIRAADIVNAFIPISLGIVCAFHETRLRGLFARSGMVSIIAGVVLTVVLMRLMSTRLQPAALALYPFAIAWMFFSSVFSTTPTRRLLSHPVMTAVGRASYGIYLWQQLATTRYEGAGWPFYVVTVAAAILGPILLFKVFDKPLINLGRKASERLSARPRPVTGDAEQAGAPSAGAVGDAAP